MLNWINIDERRPDPEKDGEKILVTRKIRLRFSGKEFLITESDRIYIDKGGAIRLGSGNHWSGVTAWMPFPRPYGEEGEK